MEPLTVGPQNRRDYEGHLKERGRKSEDIVINFLKKRPDVLGVLDFRDLRVVQEIDVDIAIKTADGLVTLAEIKSDAHLGVTGNVLFESIRVNHTCDTDYCITLAWGGRTPAKYILYHAPNVNKIYQFRTDLFRKAMQRYTQRVRNKSYIDVVPTDVIKSTINFLIPIRECAGSYVVHDLKK